MPGYSRIRCGRGFYYTDSSGKRITDPLLLERFRALVIPPAWKNVWISPSSRGHLQATGIDEEGRKQYRYHPEWTKDRQQEKLARMVAFGFALPRIRKQVAADFRVNAFTLEKVTAVALRVMEATLIRVGNEQYRRKYGSHGLTTLKKKHISIAQNEVMFKFRGKKGVWQEITVRSASLAEVLSMLCQLPGAALFQYVDDAGSRHRLNPVLINAYIQRCLDGSFSSKDYRTWYAGLWAFRLFARQPDPKDEKECKAIILSVLDAVSRRLGNTRTVCKQYYVPDSLITAYEKGVLQPYLRNSLNSKGISTPRQTENQFLAFLKDAAK